MAVRNAVDEAENKTVLVTGSTDGVGRLVARRLADQGARVLIHGRDRIRGEQLLNQIRAAGRGSAVFLPADFSSLAEVRRLPDVVRKVCDRLDILVNNAGISSGGSAGIRETSQDGHELRFAVNYLSGAHQAAAAAHDARKAGPHRERLFARPTSDRLRRCYADPRLQRLARLC